jgi:hypothetical protein
VAFYVLAIFILAIPYLAGNIYIIRLFHGSLKKGYEKEKFWKFIFLFLAGWPAMLIAVFVLLFSGRKIVFLDKKNDDK